MNKTSVDLESTDYDVKNVGAVDERMEAGRKDAVFFHVLGLVATILATIWMFAFGTGDPAQMKYFLGFPMWVTGAILIYLAMFVIGIIYLIRWKESPLTARDKKGGTEK